MDAETGTSLARLLRTQRIAHLGLFPDPVGSSVKRTTAGNVRSSQNG